MKAFEAPPIPALPVPPAWLVTEIHQKLVLLLNHILMQEPAASTRLKRQAGRVVHIEWPSFQHFVFSCVITKAGLLDLAASDAGTDLKISINQPSPLLLVKDLINGTTPSLHITGDVQLAAEINWIIQHTRWDIAEDLQRLLGPGMAVLISQIATKIRQALHTFTSTNTTPKHQDTH